MGSSVKQRDVDVAHSETKERDWRQASVRAKGKTVADPYKIIHTDPHEDAALQYHK
jgi:hypothetical protein